MVSSDGIGLKPFSSNLNRGKWEKPSDYLFACFGLALKMDIFVDTYWFYFDTGSKYTESLNNKYIIYINNTIERFQN